MIGTPIIHESICVHIDKKSSYYNAENLMKNDYFETFDSLCEKLMILKVKHDIPRAFLHIDGWGVNGYDNNHPDIMPPCIRAGGFAGLKKLNNTCANLDYILALHDNYRNYFRIHLF